MSTMFPSAEWLKEFENKINSDERYAQIAKNWEGDMYFIIEPEGNLKAQFVMYLDLWHGKCRGTEVVSEISSHHPAFTLKADYGNFAKVLTGDLDPMQAMLTRKLDVKGSMAVMMRNVPTVLDFVRCAREMTKEIL
ncbi:MAG: SCP2 sterol-binding domain-containing protein [Chloroflexi bacterium]|nr:SCP2 sterol-binding domain-containing protein [Chloroflexota bacterium]